MDGLKKNMVMLIPQTLIMSWINFFFSGFVLIKLPFPLTVRFKAMLQRGVETQDMDVRWVSSLSWYFLNLFGLKNVYTLLLGEGNGAEGVSDMGAMGAMGGAPGANPMQPAQDMAPVFKSEREFLALAVHHDALAGIEEHVLEQY
ncbi:DUF850-domain-containing protein, partial [Caulochytrium protostelioides]